MNLNTKILICVILICFILIFQFSSHSSAVPNVQITPVTWAQNIPNAPVTSGAVPNVQITPVTWAQNIPNAPVTSGAVPVTSTQNVQENENIVTSTIEPVIQNRKRPDTNGNFYYCLQGDPKGCTDCLYMYAGNRLQNIPNDEVGNSWDPSYRQKLSIVDCTGIPLGSDLSSKPKEMDTVKCFGDDQTAYGFSNGLLRKYPNPQIAESWNPTVWSDIKTVDCGLFQKGKDFGYKLNVDNTVTTCETNDPKNCENNGCVYWFKNGKLYDFPKETADKWLPDWQKDVKRSDCTGFQVENLPEKTYTKDVSGIQTTSGDVLKFQCDSEKDAINKIRLKRVLQQFGERYYDVVPGRYNLKERDNTWISSWFGPYDNGRPQFFLGGEQMTCERFI